MNHVTIIMRIDLKRNKEDRLTYTMVQNILSFEKICDYFENVVIVAPS
jgi:hypothetical protein